MTYTAGGLIQAVDYNTFAQGGASPDANVANINTIWGVGTLDKGWGQSTTLSTVAAPSTVTATQWSDMFSRFTSIASQTNTTVTAIANPTVGDTIALKNNFSTNLTSCFTNRNNAAAVGSTITASGVATRSTPWNTTLTATHTITFATAAAARYFFNAGGRITWAGARSGGSATSENTAWSDLLTACGTLNFTTGTSTQAIAGTSYTGTTKTGGSGSPATYLTTVGFYDLTTSDQEVFKQLDSTYLYTSNFVSINIKANAAAGSATVVTITVVFSDPHTRFPDAIDGTLTSTITAVAPSTTYLTNTWGTPTLTSSITGDTTYAVNYLVVAGGGGGAGGAATGGGGGGDVKTGSATVTIGQVYTANVGLGGAAGGSGGANGTAGSNSVFSGTGVTTVTSVGGGFGSYNAAGGTGGSGGGGGGTSAGGASTGTGSAGGAASASLAGGGGGGAGAVGQAGSSQASPALGPNWGGYGGAGVASSITGGALYYGAGGGGGVVSGANPPYYPGVGGSGVGGNASIYINSALILAGTAGATNTGSGGGAGRSGIAGGAGAAGTVIFAIPTSFWSNTYTGTAVVTTVGDQKILQFTGSGTWTA